MKKHTKGTITIVQETRFWLTDTAGVAHHFTVAHDAQLPSTSLAELQARDVCVVVYHIQSAETISNIAHCVQIAD